MTDERVREPLPFLGKRTLRQFFRADASGDGRRTVPSHGDFALWNALRVDDGWVLVDREQPSASMPNFLDPRHYLVQNHALLERLSELELVRAPSGEGMLSASLTAYAAGAGLDLADARGALRRYLEDSRATLDLATLVGREGLTTRTRLLPRMA
jgi:hypothetical protein